MSPSIERMPCANCDYTSDPGSLFCALCGSPLRRAPAGRRRTAAAFTALAGPTPSGLSDRSVPAGLPEGIHASWRPHFTAPPPGTGPAKRTFIMGEEPGPQRRPWLLVGLGAAALALAFRLCLLALNPPGRLH